MREAEEVEGEGGRRRRDTEPKTRTPHKDVGKKGKDRRHEGENTRTWQTLANLFKPQQNLDAGVGCCRKNDCKTGRAHGVIHHERTKHLVLKYGTSVFDVHQQPKPQGGEITVLNIGCRMSMYVGHVTLKKVESLGLRLTWGSAPTFLIGRVTSWSLR